MKKRNIIRLSVIAGILGICAVACNALQQAFALTDEKVTSVQTSAPLEKKYTQFGSYSVEMVKFPAEGTAKEYTVFYPQGKSGEKFPLIAFANGTGAKVSSYLPVLKHLASWGFVVIGNEEGSSWKGENVSKSIDFVLAENKKSGSVLFGKVDEKKIGVSGHSQGGVGVINAATIHKNSHLIGSVYGVSTTKVELAEGLKWPYDVSKIKVPYFMNAGTGGSDAGDGIDYNKGIAPLKSMHNNFAKVNAPAILAQRNNAEHGDMLYIANGYMAAWFLYTLNNDPTAKGVFVGNSAEILKNSNWREVKSKNLK